MWYGDVFTKNDMITHTKYPGRLIMADLTLHIEGMNCQHCVLSVKKAVDGIEGVSSSDVAIGSAQVVYDESKTSKDAIAAAVQNAGYTVKDEG
jgi:copper chaperone